MQNPSNTLNRSLCAFWECTELVFLKREWPYPGWLLELLGRMGEEWGRAGLEMFVLKEPEEDEEEDKEDPGDWPLLLDKERDPGWPKVLQSSMETFKDVTMTLIS